MLTLESRFMVLVYWRFRFLASEGNPLPSTFRIFLETLIRHLTDVNAFIALLLFRIISRQLKRVEKLNSSGEIGKHTQIRISRQSGDEKVTLSTRRSFTPLTWERWVSVLSPRHPVNKNEGFWSDTFTAHLVPALRSLPPVDAVASCV